MMRSAKKNTKTAGRRPGFLNRPENTRAAILNAARHVFARRGVDGTSVREVAETAHVNNAMIYYHFKDKTDLYRAVLADSFAALDRIWEHPVFQSSATARQKLQKYIEEFIRFEHSNEELRKIMSMEFATSGESTRWLADNYFKFHYEKLSVIMKDGMRSGEFKKYDPDIVIASIIGVIVQNFITQPVAEYLTGKKMDLSVEQFGRFVSSAFLDGLALKSQKINKEP